MSFGGFKSLEEKKAYHREYYRRRKAADPNYLNDEGRKWRNNNIDKARKSSKVYIKGNGYEEHKVRARSRRRKTTKQIISKLYTEEIKQIYRNCPEGYQVDHIEPVSSKNACGLHVPWNLQYLTREDNLKKGNKTCHSNLRTLPQFIT